MRKSAAESGGNGLSLERQMAQLREMVRYCEDAVTCRRAAMLRMFEETFDPSACEGTCDNCADTSDVVTRDVSGACAAVLRSLDAGGGI